MDHPGVVKAKEMYFEHQRCYTVMEQAVGSNLDALMEETVLSTAQINVLFTKLVSAVAYLHQQGVCYRDLKPDNIVVSPDCESLKIVDFNTAHQYSEEHADIMGSTGLKHWSAPETRQALSYNELCDEWSLGLILAYMVTGKQPCPSHSFV